MCSKTIRYSAAAAKSLQSCPTLCNPIDGSPPASTVPGILQARTLEWVAISFSNAWKWKVKVKSLSRVRLLETPWTAAYHAPPSMGFSRQEYWSRVPLPSLIRYSTSLIILKFLNGPQRRHQCNKHHSDYGDINSYICLVVLSLYRLNFTSLERSSIIKFLIEKYWADMFSTTPSELP